MMDVVDRLINQENEKKRRIQPWVNNNNNKKE